MTKEELIKNQFPNDEFIQSAILQIVDKCISELEKEIAELKEKENTVHTFDVLHKEAVRKYGEVSDQLTRAKEIIRELLNSCFGYNSKTVNYEARVKAEQFLKEVSE